MKRNRLVMCVALAATTIWLVPHLRSSSGAADPDAARARVHAECRAYRADPALVDADVCRFDDYAQVFAHYHRGTDALDEAARDLAAGDPGAARVAVRRALATGDELQRRGTLIGAMTAAAVVDRALDLLDANPQLDRDVLAGASLDLALRSLDGERLQLLWALAHGELYPELGIPRGAAAVAEAIATDDAAYRELERAARARDTAGCERAAGRFVSIPGPRVCELYAAVQAKADRLARYPR